jgi:hypothetical protein
MNFDVQTVINIVLAIVSAFFGVYFGIFKGKFAQAVALLNAAVGLMTEMEAALQDGKISSEEMESIKIRFQDVKAKFNALIGKTVV